MQMTNLEHAVAHLEDSKFICVEFFGEKFTCAYKYEVIFKYEANISEWDALFLIYLCSKASFCCQMN